MNKTTPKQFEEFKKHCHYWHKRFGLGDYELDIGLVKLDGNNAETKVMHTAARICIELNTKLEKRITDDLSRVALHEVLHGLLGSLGSYSRDARPNWIIDEEEHKVINHIINALNE